VSFFLLEGPLMTAWSSRSGSRGASEESLQKPRGSIHARVQQIGPEHFGIVCVDCAKARSKWLLADFYGKLVVPPTQVAPNRVELDFMISQVRRACQEHNLRRPHPGPRGPQPLGDILAIVLARLGVGLVQSKEPGESNPT
jgi:hypothetical protein